MHRSVPPLSEPSGIAPDTASLTHRKPAAGRGAPVDPTPRSLARSRSRPGCRPAARQAMRNGALTPRYVVPVSAARRHSVERSGQAGLPSNSTRVDPVASARDEVVPHHPAGRREPAEPVVRPEVGMEGERLEVFEEDAAVAVDDRLGQPGGPRREQHVQRVVERDAVEGERPGLGEQRRPGDRPRDGVDGLGLGAQIGHDDGRPEAGQGGADLGDGPGPVDLFVAVPVAVDREQHRGLDLGEPVDDGPRPELGRAGRPGSPERCRRQEADHGLGDVRHVRGDAVTAPHALAHQARTTPCDGVAQRRGGQLGGFTRLRSRDDHDVVRGSVGHRQGVLGVVHQGVGEPAGAGHSRIGEGGAGRPLRADAEVVPDRLPERARLIHRPAPRVVVGLERQAPVGGQPGEIAAHARALARVGGWRPEDLGRDVGHAPIMPRERRRRITWRV